MRHTSPCRFAWDRSWRCVRRTHPRKPLGNHRSRRSPCRWRVSQPWRPAPASIAAAPGPQASDALLVSSGTKYGAERVISAEVREYAEREDPNASPTVGSLAESSQTESGGQGANGRGGMPIEDCAGALGSAMYASLGACFGAGSLDGPVVRTTAELTVVPLA